MQALVNRQVSIQSERTIPLGAIKFVSASTLKDDWFSLGVSSPQQADPLINCVFKTEFFTQLKLAMPGGFNLKISEMIEYNKKPGKPSTVKAIKDPSVPRDDFYKSGAIHTGPGEPPNSVSKRTPKPKQVAGKPITKGKLLRPGGPGGAPGKLSSRSGSSRPIPQPPPQRNTQHSQPAAAQPKPFSQAATPQSRPVPQPLAAVNGISHTRNESASSVVRTPPPPPPAAPPATQKDTHKALYDFAGQSEIELTVTKDEIVEVVKKEPNGMTSNSYPFHLCIPSQHTNIPEQAGGSLKSSMAQPKDGPPQHTLVPTPRPPNLSHPRLHPRPSLILRHHPPPTVAP